MSRLTIVEGNSNNKNNVRAIMVKGEKGEQGDLNNSHIVDNLTTDDNTKVLSAKQGKVLNDIAKKKPYYFDTIAEMKLYELKVGDYAITKGYYEENDGGAGEYEIVDNDTLTDDGGSIIELGNGLKAKLIINDNVNVKQFGAKGDNATNDGDIIQKAINYCHLNNKKLYFKAGTYLIEKPIILYEEVEIVGEDRRKSIIKKTTNTTGGKNNINAVIICENSSGINRNYTQGQKIKNICIQSASKIATYGIYSHTAMPFTEFYNLVISSCNEGIRYNSGSWQSVAREIHIMGCNTGISYKNTGTSSVFENIYVWEPQIGFDITGLGYSTLSNLAVDGATETPYKFTGCNIDINGLGSESTNYSNRVITMNNSYITIKSGFVYVNETAEAVFGLHNSVLDFRGSIGYNKQEDVNTAIFSCVNNATLILRNCNIYSNFLVNPKTISTSDARNKLRIIDGQTDITYGLNTEFNTIGDNNTFTQNLGAKLGINYIPPTINGNCFNNINTGLENNREWQQALNSGAISVNSAPYSSGVAFFQTITPNVNLHLKNTILEINGNIITLENLDFTDTDAKYDYPLRSGVKLTNGNGATGTISSITDTSITFSNVTGTFNVGDVLYIPRPTYIRDQSHRAVQQLLQGITANRPLKPRTGLQYFDTTLGKPIWYTGTKWVDATGTDV